MRRSPLLSRQVPAMTAYVPRSHAEASHWRTLPRPLMLRPRRILPRLLCAVWWLVAGFLMLASMFTVHGF
jgi:hypothetical protein